MRRRSATAARITFPVSSAESALRNGDITKKASGGGGPAGLLWFGGACGGGTAGYSLGAAENTCPQYVQEGELSGICFPQTGQNMIPRFHKSPHAAGFDLSTELGPRVREPDVMLSVQGRENSNHRDGREPASKCWQEPTHASRLRPSGWPLITENTGFVNYPRKKTPGNRGHFGSAPEAGVDGKCNPSISSQISDTFMHRSICFPPIRNSQL